ncbi:MAG: asparaginase [Acidobacteria bacterium]|nr:asparaginase [Acidobacteriota bacterium]
MLRKISTPHAAAFFITALAFCAIGGKKSWAADDELPRIKFIATGGTIATRGSTRLSAEEVLELVPGLGRYARPDPEQFANVASTAMTLDQWVQLAKRVNTVFDEDADLAGAVITSGTDSLEELAYFLHLTVKTTKPVVVVGAMRSANAPGYEGPANILDAFRVATSADSFGKGVLVVLNDEINSAREVTKTDALRLQTFQSRPYGILGVVDPDRVVYYREPVKRHTQKTEFDVSRLTALPRVDIMMFYQGASGDLLRAAVDAGAKGVVIAVAGADLTGGSLASGIAYAEGRGVMVVIATRTGSGRIAALSASRVRDGLIGGEDLTPLKARILLMLALTRTRSPTDIQRMFTEY